MGPPQKNARYPTTSTGSRPAVYLQNSRQTATRTQRDNNEINILLHCESFWAPHSLCTNHTHRFVFRKLGVEFLGPPSKHARRPRTRARVLPEVCLLYLRPETGATKTTRQTNNTIRHDCPVKVDGPHTPFTFGSPQRGVEILGSPRYPTTNSRPKLYLENSLPDTRVQTTTQQQNQTQLPCKSFWAFSLPSYKLHSQTRSPQTGRVLLNMSARSARAPLRRPWSTRSAT